MRAHRLSRECCLLAALPGWSRTSSSSMQTLFLRPRLCSRTARRLSGLSLLSLTWRRWVRTLSCRNASARSSSTRVLRVLSGIRARSSLRSRLTADSLLSPLTCSRSLFLSRLASSVQTSLSEPRSVSAFRWASADRTLATCRCVRASNVSCPAVSLECLRMPLAIPPTGSRCRLASSTSVARRRPPTSVPLRFCLRSWHQCTPSTTGLRASSGSLSAFTKTPRSSPLA